MDKIKPTIWIFSIEPLESRYTSEWHTHFPKLLESELGDKFRIMQIDGIQKNTQTTPGAFLNFSDTNYWKSSQLCNFLDYYNRGQTSTDDQFIFTDAWNPTIIQIKYMKDLLGFNWKLSGLWHAGSYDKFDALGRLIGDDPWVRNAELSFFHAFDHNYFATEFHIEMFISILERTTHPENIASRIAKYKKTGKIVRIGWPMEYMVNTLAPYVNTPKEDIIIFPHRIAPEKQPEIFRDLAASMPEYKFVVCQDHKLSKFEYHKLLAKSKIMWSANLQETLGISPFEGTLLGVIPMLPDRLSYTEMYPEQYKYPSEFTESFDAYLKNKQIIMENIRFVMERYDTLNKEVINKLAPHLLKNYFSATTLVKQLLRK